MNRVLIVDDEQGMRDWLSWELESRGFSVRTAMDGDAALAILADDPVDVVVTDVMMPVRDGLSLLQTAKRTAPRTELIVMTGAPEVRSAAACVRGGAFDYLAKPFAVDELVSTIDRALARQKANTVQMRLALAGELGASVMHEISNALMGVVGAHQELRDRLDGDGAEAALRDAEAYATTVIDMARDFGKLGGQARPAALTDLRRPLETALRLTRAQRRIAGECDVQIETDECVIADPGQLTQVFVNLLVNAAHAIEGRNNGAISVRVTRQEDRVVLEVSDNGAGIADEIMPRIFDAFFTTKPAGVGTGLGLSVSRHIVRSFGGELTARSVPGAGATFTVSLPVA